MSQTGIPGRWRRGAGAPPAPRKFRPEGLTLALLLVALSTLFLRSVDKGYFYSPQHHDWNSVLSLTIAENLSPDHNFRLFTARQTRQGEAPVGLFMARQMRLGGDPVRLFTGRQTRQGEASPYHLYGRFPVGGYALVKLAVLPFGNDLSAKLLAARMLMLLLFSAAALLAFHSLARITSHRWTALAATLVAFSSYYMLFHNDAPSVEYSVDLFAVMLVFHGMVVFVQEGGFRRLLARTFVALLLGWHVYAFLLPFVLLGLAREAVRAWKDGTALWLRVRSAGAAVLRSRYTALGLAALLFGMVVLSFNLANEYAAFGGETSVTELPSVQSMLRRTGLGRDSAHLGWWLRFLQGQFFRVCVASVPWVVSEWGVGLLESFFPVRLSSWGLSGPALWVCLLALLVAVGAAAALVRLARPLLDRGQRMLLAVLAVSGFFWALPMRHNAAYLPHEPMYYVGVPLAFCSLLLLYVHKRWGHGAVVGLAAASLLAFVVSAFRMDHPWGPDARAVEKQRVAMAELGSIRETTRGKTVLALGSVEPEWFRHLLMPFVWKYYLAGSVFAVSRDMEVAARAADFIVTYDRVESEALLTPGNRQVFLYDAGGIDDLVGLYRGAYRRAVSGDPVARSYFDAYLVDDAPTFVKEPCVREDAGIPISMYVVPEDRKHLPRMRPGGRSSHPQLWLGKPPVLFEGKCIVVLPLPDYPFSSIRAQTPYPRSKRILDDWEARIPVSVVHAAAAVSRRAGE